MSKSSTLTRLQIELTEILGFDPIQGNMSPNGLEYGPEGRRYYWAPFYLLTEGGKLTPAQSYGTELGYSHVTFGSRPESGTVRQMTRLLSMLHANSVLTD